MKSVLLAVCAALACAPCAAAASEDGDAPAPRRRVADMPKVATSADGFAEVIAADVPGDPVGFRLPILQFCTRELREIERVYKMEMPRGGAGLVVHALGGTSNDTRVVVRPQRRRGRLVTRLYLPAPGHSDLAQLRFAVAQAYFNAWIDRMRPRPDVAAGALPDWVVAGALRAADKRLFHDDIRFALDVWSQGRMPFFPALCRAPRLEGAPSPELAGYLVSFMREKRLFVPALERLAAGRAWEAPALARALTDETDPAAQDRAHDERLARLTRSVLSPGAASAWDVQVFTSRLTLYPATYAADGSRRASWTFAEAAKLASENEEVRAAAARKAREMPFYALGRGEALAAAAEKYRLFLLGVARGAPHEELKPLLAEADAALAKLH